jgi:hypothetical protein
MMAFSNVIFSQVPLNWTRDEVNPGEDFTLTVDESFVTEGTKSLHMQLNTGSVPYLVSDVFYINPGSEYDFSLDVFDHDTAGMLKVYADFYDTYGFNIYGEPPQFSTDSSEWQVIGWQGTIPAQAAVGYILIKFFNQPDPYHFIRKADIWIDNVQFNQSGSGNLVMNGSFENWNVGIDNNRDNDQAFFIYPNPAKDFVNVNYCRVITELRITDVSGREIYFADQLQMQTVKINVTAWPEGMYIISGKNPKGNLFYQKLIIN